MTRLLGLCCIVGAVAGAHAAHDEVSVVPRTPRELHQQYSMVFQHGNRNAASHRWSSYILERATSMPDAQLELLFSGFCAVSGSPVSPGDYKRYRLHLAHAATGAPETGFMYYCCWPCVCDTHDFIKVDTLTITTSEGPKQRRFAVIGDPCANEAQLDVPFIQPFDGRTTTLRRDAPEVRCSGGRLEGATFSDHGHVILTLFFDSPDDAAPVDAVVEAPQPGRVTTAGGVLFQDDVEWTGTCADRASRGYDSGMGEIFRKVAAITPIEAPIGALAASA
mmetsp:Transcript_36387/g.111560  ORF Transcript_36387/g.111560 Transcript_36387/m.111560 type:complete len:278 (+) Transcript_36387:578-1411(+)